MKDAELRSALLRFFEETHAQSEVFLKALETTLEQIADKDAIYDALEGQMKFVLKLQLTTKHLMNALAGGRQAEQTDAPEMLTSEFVSFEAESVDGITNRSSEEQTSPPVLGPYEQELVTAYNERPGKWARDFRPTGFGAENVNEIWGSGGEPKFARKEGGIYNLVEANGACYVVPEPGLRLQESYFRSEGLRYLFDLTGNSTESEPLIALIAPAHVEEAGGRWNILRKGEIRGRS